MSPQKRQVVGHGRDDRGEVPTGPLLRAVDLPTSRPPCARPCRLLPPQPPSQLRRRWFHSRVDDAAGSTAAAPEGAPPAAPPSTPHAPPLCSNRACGRDAVAVHAAVPHVQRGRSRPEASLLAPRASSAAVTGVVPGRAAERVGGGAPHTHRHSLSTIHTLFILTMRDKT